MNLKEAKYIHLIGIGGIGVSSLAHILKRKGKIISGSDICPSEITTGLKREGIKINQKHHPENINPNHQLVIYSPAISSDNPELTHAKNLKIKCLSYPEALGELTKDYFTVAISGTHGKSTTVGMIATMAVKANLDPTVVIGTKLKEFKNQNYRVGESNLLIIEACEYKDSFLNFHPNILVITNIEADHLDYFKNLNNYKKSFAKLIANVDKTGTVIINNTDQKGKNIAINSKAEVCKLDQLAVNQIKNPRKEINFYLHKNTLITPFRKKLTIKPGIAGQFNLQNASMAAIVGLKLGITQKTIISSIKAYKGSWRRMEYKRKKLGKVKFIDDYGHHPTEIKLTLEAIRTKHPKSKILCIYQPHQYNRTLHFLKDFANSFNNVDAVIIPDIYKVRDNEKDLLKISTDQLVKKIQINHKNVQNGNGLKKTAEYIKKNHSKYNIIVTMGAGNINDIYKMF